MTKAQNETRPTPPPPWEPEPLELPIETPSRSIDDRPPGDRRSEDDRPGTHVIVIDLA